MRIAKRISAGSSARALGAMDGRTFEARYVKDFRQALTAHVGGNPTIVQQALIDQAVQLKLRLAIMDRATATHPDGEVAEKASKTYLGWANALTRLLRQLGQRGVAPRAQTLGEMLAYERARDKQQTLPPAQSRKLAPVEPEAAE